MTSSEIDSSSLADILNRSHHCLRKFLIVDCRCFFAYNDSHIKNAVNAFYSKLVRRRLRENKVCAAFLLQQLLGSSEKNEYKSLHDQFDLVLYDEQQKQWKERRNWLDADNRRPLDLDCKNINGDSFVKDSSKFISMLIDKLNTSDQFGHVMVLKGGFVDFQSRYPELCEGATMQCQQLNDNTCDSSGQKASKFVGPKLLPISLSQPCLPISGTDGPTKILPFLYLGSQQDALNVDTLKKYGIDYLINLSINCPRPEHFSRDEHFLRIPVNDSYQEKLLPHFNRAFDFLDKVRESNSAVLVHCLAGISRSPTMAIAYIMKQCNMTSDEAYSYVKTKRPSISPNFNFMGQLLEYERLLKDEPRHREWGNNNNRSLSVSPVAKEDHDDKSESKCSDKDSKMGKSVSSGQLRSERNQGTPASTTNENGKRQMHSNCVVERPQGLVGLKTRKMLHIPQAVDEDLPSPSTELSKLSFSPTSIVPFCRPLTSYCPSYSSRKVDESPPVEKINFEPILELAPIRMEQMTTCTRTDVFASNPFFDLSSRDLQSSLSEVITVQPRGFSVENPVFDEAKKSTPSALGRSGLSRLTRFLRRTPQSSIPTFNADKSTVESLPRSSTLDCVVSKHSSDNQPPRDPHFSSSASSSSASSSYSYSLRTKSHSDSTILFTLADRLDSPESGFVESPSREADKSERESMGGSTSSLEIVVN